MILDNRSSFLIGTPEHVCRTVQQLLRLTDECRCAKRRATFRTSIHLPKTSLQRHADSAIKKEKTGLVPSKRVPVPFDEHDDEYIIRQPDASVGRIRSA